MRHVLLDFAGQELTAQESEELLGALIAKLNAGVKGFGADKQRAELERRVRTAWAQLEQEFRERSVRV